MGRGEGGVLFGVLPAKQRACRKGTILDVVGTQSSRVLYFIWTARTVQYSTGLEPLGCKTSNASVLCDTEGELWCCQ